VIFHLPNTRGRICAIGFCALRGVRSALSALWSQWSWLKGLDVYMRVTYGQPWSRTVCKQHVAHGTTNGITCD
jgi:hypothetical protein